MGFGKSFKINYEENDEMATKKAPKAQPQQLKAIYGMCPMSDHHFIQLAENVFTAANAFNSIPANPPRNAPRIFCTKCGQVREL
jgi:hypothetical protein